jgi:amino acid transporter
MSFLDRVLGRPLSTDEAEQQQIGPAAGIPVLGLDALSSAAYGPEAALTLLLPLGVAGLRFAAPIVALIVTILLVVYFSYRQTIEVYPGGGGSYTVARENLGPRSALLAGAALALDYVLNVAVGISAGVGALVSALPSLLPHTLAVCLAILGLLTMINLRGVRESALAFMVPTYAFVVTLAVVTLVGLAKSLLSGGHPAPVVAPPSLPRAVEAASLWILLRAFASGCTAMTGVEAVSNGVPLFRAPTVKLAQRTLAAIIAILIALLLGIAYLCRAYGIGATEPGQVGYQSILSMLIGAVMGRGAFYYVTIASIVAVLSLSANTSFADFPRLCRVLAQDRYLPDAFAERGRRLVYSGGIVTLAFLSGALLVVFGGITDRLIPLFAIGAFLAFTLSQAGMVQHWRRVPGRGKRRALVINTVGTVATGGTLIIVAVSKFGEGAWLTIVVVPLLLLLFVRVNRHYRRVAMQIETVAPMEMPRRESPVVVVAAGSWSKLTQHGLKFALRLSSDVHVVQVRTETDNIEDFADNWELLIASPARAAGIPPPKLTILTSSYRRFFGPFVDFVNALEGKHSDRDIVVVIPDLVMNHWYEGLLHNNRGAFLRTLLRLRCSSRVVVVNTPFHLQERRTASVFSTH